MRTHWWDSTISSSPIDTDTITRNTHAVHLLSDRVISTHSVAVRSYNEPLPALVSFRVLGAFIGVRLVAISGKVKLLHHLEDIHIYLRLHITTQAVLLLKNP